MAWRKSIPIGTRFTRLVVLRELPPDGGAIRYECRCDCGAVKVLKGFSLRLGDTASCGCLRRETTGQCAKKRATHGHSRARKGLPTPEYRAWQSMHQRCGNSKVKDYKNYGARGIKVCEQWFTFEAFLSDIGPRPSAQHSLDRYPNNDGNYEPGNCRWATSQQQNLNKKRSKSNGNALILEIQPQL